MSIPADKTLIQAIAANWWVVLIRGILLAILGFYALLVPGLTLVTWAVIVGCFLIADGILSIVAGLTGSVESRLWTLLRGVLVLLVGGFAIWQPALFGASAGLAFVLILAASQIVGGILEIIVAIRERKEMEGEVWMVLGGGISILFGIVLALAPLLALSMFIRIAGVFAIIFGVVLVFSSFKLRSWGTNLTAADGSTGDD